jgi:DNA (cytosine-5)-methyltransferase 1
VLGALAALGYDAEWHCIPAASLGAPHRRDRVWVVAYTMRDRSQGAEPAGAAPGVGRRSADAGAATLAYANESRLEGWGRPLLPQCAGQCVAGQGGAYVAHAGEPDGCGRLAWAGRGCRSAPHAAAERGRGDGEIDGQWLIEPCVGRVAHGVPRRVDRLKALGNAIVPQIAELIGRAIVEKHAYFEGGCG